MHRNHLAFKYKNKSIQATTLSCTDHSLVYKIVRSITHLVWCYDTWPWSRCTIVSSVHNMNSGLWAIRGPTEHYKPQDTTGDSSVSKFIIISKYFCREMCLSSTNTKPATIVQCSVFGIFKQKYH